jgi:hypothetical protein
MHLSFYSRWNGDSCHYFRHRSRYLNSQIIPMSGNDSFKYKVSEKSSREIVVERVWRKQQKESRYQTAIPEQSATSQRKPRLFALEAVTA